MKHTRLDSPDHTTESTSNLPGFDKVEFSEDNPSPLVKSDIPDSEEIAEPQTDESKNYPMNMILVVQPVNHDDEYFDDTGDIDDIALQTANAEEMEPIEDDLVVKEIVNENKDFDLIEAETQDIIEPEFCIFQSNILYTLFFLSSILYLLAEIWITANRYSENFPMLFTFLLASNLILWIDFNMDVFKIKVFEMETMNCTCLCLEDLFQDTTNSLLCILILPFMLLQRMLRCHSLLF